MGITPSPFLNMIKDSEQLDLLDLLSLIGFYIGLLNLELNVTQSDIDGQTQVLDEKLHVAVEDIQKHLEIQDKKLDWLIKEISNDKNKETGRRNEG